MLALVGASGHHMAQVVTGVSLPTAGFDIRPVTLRFLVDKADNYFLSEYFSFHQSVTFTNAPYPYTFI
jgi:hypothetical protein